MALKNRSYRIEGNETMGESAKKAADDKTMSADDKKKAADKKVSELIASSRVHHFVQLIKEPIAE